MSSIEDHTKQLTASRVVPRTTTARNLEGSGPLLHLSGRPHQERFTNSQLQPLVEPQPSQT